MRQTHPVLSEQRWKIEFANDGKQAFRAQGVSLVEDEPKRLRAENKRLLIEQDILKKATSANVTGQTHSFVGEIADDVFEESIVPAGLKTLVFDPHLGLRLLQHR